MAAVTCSVVDTRTGAPASGMRVILRSLSHQVSFFQDLTLPCGGGFQWNVASFMQSVTASTETIWLISFDTGTYFGTDPRTYISQTTSWPEVNVYFYLRKDQGYIVTMHIGPESYTARGLYTSLPFILRTDGNQVRGQYGMAGKPYPVEPRGLIQPQTPSSGFTEPQNFTIRKMPRDRPSLSTTWEPERSHIPSVNVGHTLGMPRAYPQTVGRRKQSSKQNSGIQQGAERAAQQNTNLIRQLGRQEVSTTPPKRVRPVDIIPKVQSYVRSRSVRKVSNQTLKRLSKPVSEVGQVPEKSRTYDDALQNAATETSDNRPQIQQWLSTILQVSNLEDGQNHDGEANIITDKHITQESTQLEAQPLLRPLPNQALGDDAVSAPIRDEETEPIRFHGLGEGLEPHDLRSDEYIVVDAPVVFDDSPQKGWRKTNTRK